MHKVTKKDWGAPTKQKKKHRVVFRIFLKYRNFAAELKIITMEFTGKIIAILQPRGGVSKTGNEWKSQEYVIENHDQYPRKMCFDVFGADKIEQFNIQMGEDPRLDGRTRRSRSSDVSGSTRSSSGTDSCTGIYCRRRQRRPAVLKKKLPARFQIDPKKTGLLGIPENRRG